MNKISFNNWFELNQTVAGFNPTDTAATAPTVIHKGSTVQTPQQTTPAPSNSPDPEVGHATGHLKDMQDRLSDIFKRIMSKPIWKNPKTKEAFGDRVTRGWEKVGQAKAILEPLGLYTGDIDDV